MTSQAMFSAECNDLVHHEFYGELGLMIFLGSQSDLIVVNDGYSSDH